MITQDVKNPKLQGLGGLIIVLCILLAIFLAVILSALARPLVGALASSLFVWLVGRLRGALCHAAFRGQIPL